MKKYLGVKLIEAEPMTHGKYAKEKYGENNAINTTEFSIQNKESEGYKVKYDNNYISWSPKVVFEEAYRRIDNLNFGLAIEAIKKGHKVAREGWDGKGLFVYYVPDNSYKTQTEVAKKEFGEYAKYNHYMALKGVDGVVSTWVPSVTDCLADDWVIIEELEVKND